MLLRNGNKQVGEWHFFITLSSIYAHSKTLGVKTIYIERYKTPVITFKRFF